MPNEHWNDDLFPDDRSTRFRKIDKKFNQTLTTRDLDKVAHAHLAKEKDTTGRKPT